VSVEADGGGGPYWEGHYYMDQKNSSGWRGEETKYVRVAAARGDLPELDRGMCVKSRSLCRQLPSFY
jgi:hypothetical protein